MDNMTEIRKILGENMKAYRSELGYSQSRLAELVNTATNYIAQIENGKRFPTDKMLEKIAAALQRRSFELFNIAPYEKKVEKDWQAQVLNDLENFIHTRIAIVKNGQTNETPNKKTLIHYTPHTIETHGLVAEKKGD
jgi:transcriptional regulator with XRE-family HTH domain